MSLLASGARMGRLGRAIGMLRDIHWAQRVATMRLPPGDFAVRPEGLLARRWNIVVPKSIGDAFLKGYFQLVELEERYGAGFAIGVEEGALALTLGDLRFRARQYPDIDVLTEVFVRELYEFSHPREVVVWDIGMNVGAATLAFARDPHVVAVHGYELFPPTFENALENFRLNPGVAAKIKPVAAGVGDRDATLELPYSAEFKGVMGFEAPTYVDRAAMKRHPVTVRNAASCLRDIVAAHPGRDVLLKMDCEGAEEAILASLDREPSLEAVALVLMEWHERERLARVSAILRRHGYSFARNTERATASGMLYAFRGVAAARG